MRPTLLLVVLAGCSSAAPTTADYVADGKYGIGVHTFSFVDDSRPTPDNKSCAGSPSRALKVEVWYPSSQEGGPFTDPPLARGAFPLILHSHGFMDGRRGEAYLAEHLASRGYLVAAPDYPLSNGGAPCGAVISDTAQQPLDARFVIDQLLAQSADPSSPIGGAIDAQRIAASGLSLGGLTTLLLALHPTSRDPRIKAALAIAPPSCMFTAPFFAGPSPPLLFLHGESDQIVPLAQNSARAFPLSQPPSELVVLQNGSHTGFAGAAALLPSDSHLDTLGCSAIAGATDVTSFSSLGSEAQGISPDPNVCPMPCQHVPATPALDAERQQTLTKAIAQAFFDAHLAADTVADTWLQTRVDRENAEVMVTYKK